MTIITRFADWVCGADRHAAELAEEMAHLREMLNIKGEVDDCGTECPACEGSGRVECSACSAEPDGDYEYERRRDAMLDKP